MLYPSENIDERHNVQRRLLDKLPLAILECDKTGIATWSNQAFKQLTGYAGNRLELSDLLKSSSGLQELSLKKLCSLKKANGSVIQASIRPIPLNEQQEDSAILYAIHDQSAYSNLKERFLRAQRSEAVGALASAICHEFNNFLTPLVLASQFLKSDGLPAAQQKFADMIEQSSQKASQLVSQILELSRSQQKDKIHLNPTLITKEMEKFLLSALPRNVNVKSSICKESCMVLASPSHIFQSLLNASMLAFSHALSSNGGKLTLNIERTDSLSLAETAGINLPHDSYVQIHISATGDIEPDEDAVADGKEWDLPEEVCGLGATAAQEAINLAMSEIDGIFKTLLLEPNRYKALLAIPLSKTSSDRYLDTKEPILQREEPAAKPSNTGASVLIVEENEDICAVLSECASNNGYTPIVCSNGAQALLEIGKSEPCIHSIIINLNSRYIGGAKIARFMRERDSNIQIHAITSSQSAFEQARESRDLFDTVSKKPFESSHISSIFR